MFLGVLLCNYCGIPVWLLGGFVWGVAMHLLGCSRWLLRHSYVVARVFLAVLGVLPCIYIYIYAFSRDFYPKRLTVHSGYTFFMSICYKLCSCYCVLYGFPK